MYKNLFKTVSAILLSLVAITSSAKELVIGSKDFTEQLLLAEMTARLFEAQGFDVDMRTGLSSVLSLSWAG